MPIRHAVLDDTIAIRDLFIGTIERWQRMDANGQVEDLPYEALTIYERWLHGGAWMSIETGALWLSHLAQGIGLAFVHTENKAITGYVEAFLSMESDPYGNHLHIARIIGNQTIHQRLIEYLINHSNTIERVTVASPVYDDKKLKFYHRYGFTELSQVTQVNLSAHGATVGFYKVTEHESADYGQIMGWQMPIGRLESSRQHWETLWAQHWHAVPEITARRIHRLRLNAGGQDAFVLIREHLYNPRTAEVFCWTPKAISAQLIGAIRDWTYKSGYRTLTMAVDEKIAKMIDSDLETTVHQHVILTRNV